MEGYCPFNQKMFMMSYVLKMTQWWKCNKWWKGTMMSEGEEEKKREKRKKRNMKEKRKTRKKEEEWKKERIPSEQRRVSFWCAIKKSMCINCLCPSQSGFLSGDSTTNQLLCIYEYLCSNFDKRITTQSVYFDISKAFNRVWHIGLILKPEPIGIRGKLVS